MTDSDFAEFERLLQKHIPLAAAMQARIEHFGGNTLTVHAPLAANQNHYGTAFGGSIYTVALLAGWGLTSLLLDQTGTVVVNRAEAEYQRPIEEDLVATARPAEDTDISAFITDFKARGKARLDTVIRMHADGQPAFQLNACFAARQ